MKKQYVTTVIATVSYILLLASGCSKQDPVDYNNKIMEVLNSSINYNSATSDMDGLNITLANDDFTNAENARKAWESKLTSSLDKLKRIGDFKGDSGFKNAGIQAIETYLKVVSKDYKRLIELRAQKDKADQNEIIQISNRINQDFEKAANTLNAASDKFAKEYPAQ
ncbi:LIC11966 family lipoprotein [Leptospira mayottensis]|uniref:Lipoprotein n=2 Tax=Leptospira mayottensis TaxID=1137606 RepID=A0AA87MNZ7_9LEPT|nr:ErpY-like lipoprotein [Leptospira mayottensis]AXR61187.1 hypothetical protein DQM68_11370 [Leptospira mayottensis]AXR65556.1 hypothetical protein DQM28_16375 [Leptospira mayottensis]AZQ02376.1 hypothetical protein LEP1GSC190_10340 [Leptospira mayottensis 200901116]EKS01015.1 putative lipoprotein [Leptospira mayottensis 200901122]TGN07860.1 hypothetical protein EHR03_09230 [Leptospira mayottensis]